MSSSTPVSTARRSAERAVGNVHRASTPSHARSVDRLARSSERGRTRAQEGALPPDGRADPLSDVLRDLRPSGVSYGHCVLTQPWGIEIGAEPVARLHIVLTGTVWIRTPDVGWCRLQRGDAVFLPQGAVHALADHPRRRLTRLEAIARRTIGDRTYEVHTGGGGAASRVVCCAVRFDEPAMHPLLALMPTTLVVRAIGATDATLGALLSAMEAEVAGARVGAATVLARLADVLVIRIVRTWVEARGDGAPEATGWAAAAHDPSIGRALAAVHRAPAAPWTTSALAREAHLSRSMFIQRFSAAVGVPPARYVVQWRMHLADAWLAAGSVTAAEAASRLGYRSEAAFGRAFKRIRGTTPGAVRRRASRDDAVAPSGRRSGAATR